MTTKGVLKMTRKTEGSLGLSWEEWRTVEDNIDEGQQNRRSKKSSQKPSTAHQTSQTGNYLFIFQFLIFSFYFIYSFPLFFHSIIGQRQTKA